MFEISLVQLSAIFLIILLIIKRPRVAENEPPLVPYTIPIIGHTFSYFFNAKKFIKECREEYGDAFSIYVFGNIMTVLSNEAVSEMFRNHDDFDFIKAIHEDIPLHKFLIYNGGMTEEGMNKMLGDCSVPKTIYNAWFTINEIIALPVTNILVGEEAAAHDDIVKSFGILAFDMGHLLVIPPIFCFIHQKLHDFVATLPIRFGYNPVRYHRRIAMKRLRPVVEKRLRERKKLGDNYKSYNDLLDFYMDQPNFDYSKPYNFHYHVDNLFIMVFASIHTTSRTAAVALYDMAARPELVEELYEEAVKVDKERNGQLTVADVKKMIKLDSFVKETLRHNDNITALPHYVKPESFTFSSGLTIPKGRKIITYIEDVLMSKENYGEDAEEFKPFRFVDQDSPATKVERSYIIFGGGRHACPGRFFAINETKLFLHKFILRYKVTTQSGKVEDKFRIGPFALPSRKALVFENRV
ncbi:cytochrome P450 [Rhizophagus clarus]|uniref:Cytochrome P450 n=1 Tax=Rhizophagus clarus TaxID=94130 RepID=A0A8H3LEE6_9GLOM|nr:cytochrome P450 [Rhizophagus clarus]